jgi:hypothetical protein
VIDADLDEGNAFDPLVDRAVRLFTFLGQAQQLKSPRVTDLEAYRRDGAVCWLHDVPEHPAVRIARQGGSPNPSDPVLTIERVPRFDPPTPDDELLAWLDGAVDNPHREPVLRDARLQVPETVLTTRDLLVRPRQMPGMIRWWRCG